VELPDLLWEHQPPVEQGLRAVMEGVASQELPLYRMMHYQLGWVDRDGTPELADAPGRLYGTLCLEAARTGKRPDLAEPAAAAVELLYQSVTVHEDMQIGDPHADGRASVWWFWGPAQAINVGDGLHAMGRLAVLGLQDKGLAPEQTLAAMRILDTAALRFYEGQYMELTFQERIDIMESQYLKLAETKYGSLMGGAMALGAQAADAGSETVEALRICGERLGLAAQIGDDVAQVWDRSSAQGASPRMLNKSKLFPVVHALERATLPQKRALGDAYFKRVMEADDVQRVRQVLEEVGAREYSEQKAQSVAQEALRSLETAGISIDARDRWASVAEFLLRPRQAGA
jgi:geranylgeranyl pyrophosphate synthase